MRVATPRRPPRVSVVVKQRPSILQRLGFVGFSLATGVAVEYLLDPDRGKARRARIRDKAAHAAHGMNDGLNGLTRDASNRGRGMVAAARYRVKGRSADDPVLHERVRETLGRHVSHPHAVTVLIQDGKATLTGDVLASEEDDARRAVRRVPGIKSVDTPWTAHENAAGVLHLQGAE
jgi:osmotically-inducible protein OsmY